MSGSGVQVPRLQSRRTYGFCIITITKGKRHRGHLSDTWGKVHCKTHGRVHMAPLIAMHRLLGGRVPFLRACTDGPQCTYAVARYLAAKILKRTLEDVRYTAHLLDRYSAVWTWLVNAYGSSLIPTSFKPTLVASLYVRKAMSADCGRYWFFPTKKVAPGMWRGIYVNKWRSKSMRATLYESNGRMYLHTLQGGTRVWKP